MMNELHTMKRIQLDHYTHKINASSMIYKCGEDLYTITLTDEEQNSLILQTPYLWMPLPPRFIINELHPYPIHYFNFSFLNYEQNGDLKNMQNFLMSLETEFQQWLNQRFQTTFQWNYSYNGQQEHMHWKISCNQIETILFFDTKRNKINVVDLLPNQHVRLLIHISDIWFKRTGLIAGINYKILQFQTLSSLNLSQFAFEDLPIRSSALLQPSSTHLVSTPSNNATTTTMVVPTIGEHPIFAKYFKMIALGVPKEAVKQKMKMSGMTEAELTMLDLNAGDPIPLSLQQTILPTLGLTETLQQGIVLKKTLPPVPNPPPSKQHKKGFGVSLHEIIQGLKSLKSTKKSLTNKPVKEVKDLCHYII